MKQQKKILFTSPLTPLLKGEGKKFLVLLLYAIIFLSLFNSDLQTQWVQVSTVPTAQLNAVKFFDAYTGVTCGVGGVWRSTNSGVNWVQVLNTTATMNSISFPDNNTGYIVGDSGKIYKSTDGGLGWNSVTSVTTNNLMTVYFINQLTGHAAGMNGIMLRSQNGGSSWVIQDAIGYSYFGLYMRTASSLYGVGTTSDEILTNSESGGTQWFGVWSMSGGGLRAMEYIVSPPIGRIFLVGLNGRIRYRPNDNINWINQASGTAQTLNAVAFTDTTNGHIVGNNGIIIKTTNTGANWITQPSGTINNLRGIDFINATTGWIVGASGNVLRQGIPVNIQKIGNEIPTEFKLYQNYPNPFNPKTIIRFKIKESGFIQLKLFDILGREVEILVNESLEQGVYEILFEGEDLPSGIYFYKLIAEDFSSTKKLLLLK